MRVNPACPRRYRTCVCTFRALCPGRKRFRLAPRPSPFILLPPGEGKTVGRICTLNYWRSVAHLFEGKNAGGRKRLLKGETPLPKEPTDATFHHPSMRPPLNCRTCVRPVSTGSATGAPAGSSAGPAACPPAAAAQPGPGPQVPPSSRRIVPGTSLAGINMGSGVNLILTRFGRPSDLRETTIDSVYNFSRWGIVVYIQSGRVSAASTSNSLLKVSDELGVGYRTEDVLKAFGRGFRQGTVEGFPGMIYDDQGVAFGMDKQAR